MNDDPELQDKMILQQRWHEAQIVAAKQAHAQRLQMLYDRGAQQALSHHRRYGDAAVQQSARDYLQHGGPDAAQYLRGVSERLRQAGNPATASLLET
jgi:hypothetical protein